MKTSEDISNFNNRLGFCFACSLASIVPDNGPNLKPNEWTSYANFLFEQFIKNKTFLLHLLQDGHANSNLVVCDLLTSLPEFANDQMCQSATSHLISLNAARSLIHNNGNYLRQTQHFFEHDEEKENFQLIEP